MANVLKLSGFAIPEYDAYGAIIRDVAGNEYIDCVGGFGAFSLGHRHPKVIAAVKAQMEKECLKSHYFMSVELAELCELLASVLPGNLQYSFICNSGTEAVEGALKAARIHTKRTEFIGAANGFHGKTFGSLSVSGRDLYKRGLEPLLPGTKTVPFGDLQAMSDAMSNQTAAVILEVIQGEGGVNVPSDAYLPGVREICDRNGALLILDEVRTGFGRTGKMFASEHYGVVPDIVAMGKALGGGVMPVGAFSSTPEVWDSLFGKNPYFHSSTFGGNPLACAAAMAAIHTTVEEGLVERSAILGERLLTGLKGIGSRYPDMVADVRGKGMVAGVEFSMDDIGLLIIASCGRRGILAAYSMNNPKVVRFEPPFVIEESQLDRAIEALGESIEEVRELAALG
jgi:putrescine aminotransferase